MRKLEKFEGGFMNNIKLLRIMIITLGLFLFYPVGCKNINDKFINALNEGDVSEVKKIMQAGYDINSKIQTEFDTKMNTLLYAR